MSKKILVIVEATRKRAFASAADWPGWARAGKTEEAAVAALAAYEDRYRSVVRRASATFPRGAGASLEVAERVDGDATTDFGAPGRVAALDGRPSGADEARRLASLVRAAWTAFDAVVAGAPVELRKGPRGGGRDTAKIVDHVLAAELAYASRIGLRLKADASDRGSVEREHAAIEEVLRAPSDGSPVGRWPIRYAARRIAWHVLDHAWEIEDRSER